MRYFFKILFLLICFYSHSQNNTINVKAKLFPQEKRIAIEQELLYYNNSNDTLQKIVLRNWGNSYKNDNSPLAKRLLSDYKTNFYFSGQKDKGYSEISKLLIDHKTLKYSIPTHLNDLVFITLNQPLLPGNNVKININYQLKIPNIKFTGSGVKGVDFFLKDWLITPSIYKNKWELNTHQNLNYQYNTPTDYHITFNTPLGYHVYGNFKKQQKTQLKNVKYTLTGKNITNDQLSISFAKTYLELQTATTKITTNFFDKDLPINLQKEKITEMVSFLKNHLGDIDQQQLLVEKNNYKQDPIYELKYLPKVLHPYRAIFKWEAEFFKALISAYASQIIVQNQETEYWFTKGLEIYFFTKYIEQNYPDTKLMGRLANLWGLKSMYIAKQNFNSKFSIVHQITARENLDQKLNTPYRKLSNYNRKVVSPYKAGIGFMFLEKYLKDNVLNNSIKEYINLNKHKACTADDFLKLLKSKTDKNINWFHQEWINTNKKIDHKITDTHFFKDSIHINIKNNRTIKTPVLVYGLKDNKIKKKLWVDGFSGQKEITIKNDSINKIVLNYENIYPEINYTNNWQHYKNKLIQRPLKVKLLKDLNNPNTHQIFLKPEANFNLYDGVLFGLSIQNQGFLSQNFHYTLKPTYGIKSNSLNGSFGINYTIFPEKSNIYSTSLGISGNHYQYDRNLNYNTISPFFSISFKQKNFRALGTNTISTRYLWVDRAIAPGIKVNDEDQYGMLRVNYTFKKNQLINNYNINLNTEIATSFTKLNTEFKYRHLTNQKRAIEFRFFGGIFLKNNTTSNFFNYNQHTANDYLFELPYLGRSETEGIYSQQYFQAQGGFVSQNNPGFANQWLTSINTSIGVYKWVEMFNNISLLKNKNQPSHFDYETGLRLNFIPNILEFYLPIYNKEGFVFKQGDYHQNIRFVLTLKSGPILKFFRQQIF